MRTFIALSISLASASTLRGPVRDEPLEESPSPASNVVTGTQPPDFNCFRAAWDGANARATCDESKASDSSSCVWCSMAGGGAAGACLSSEEAVAADGKFGLDCPVRIDWESAEEGGFPDVNCFKAAWVADNAESACGKSKDNAGDQCVWCQTDGDVMGACLSKPEASMADGQFGLKCPLGDEESDLSTAF